MQIVSKNVDSKEGLFDIIPIIIVCAIRNVTLKTFKDEDLEFKNKTIIT